MIKEIIGSRFGRLVVLQLDGFYISPKGQKQQLCLCICDCGNYTRARVHQLKSGQTRSCGCLHKETFTFRTHGDSKTRLYRIWCAMRDRCSRQGAINFKYYGGKGIEVCKEWNEDYQAFKKWALSNGYRDDLTIDRINSDIGYRPENCCWITRQENAIKAVKKREENKRKCIKT